jgi:phosphatidate cytidylyltransferase
MIRLASGLVLAGAALAAIVFLPTLGLRLLACLVAARAAHEYLRIVGTDSRSILLVVLACWFVSTGNLWQVEAVLVGVLVWVAAEVLISEHTVQQAAAGAFSGAYIGVPLGMLVAIHERAGAAAVLLLMGTVVVSDSAQYYTGRQFGRHPLAPAISPKKTIEGAAGGVVVGIAFMMMVGTRVMPAASYGALAILGFVIVAAGISGDLFESRLKRTADMKDSSGIIPGHGGVLDRIDALLFAVPPFYVFLRTVS